MWDGELDQNFDPKYWAYFIYILVWLKIFSYLQSYCGKSFHEKIPFAHTANNYHIVSLISRCI